MLLLVLKPLSFNFVELFCCDVTFLSFWAAVHVSLVVTSDLDSCFLLVEVSSVKNSDLACLFSENALHQLNSRVPKHFHCVLSHKISRAEMYLNVRHV